MTGIQMMVGFTAVGQVTGLTATNVGSGRAYNNGRIDLAWTAASGPVTGYKIERSTDGTNYSVLVSNTGNTNVSYSNTGLSSNQIYYYRVTGLNTGNPDGPTSSAANATATTVPQAPTIGTATNVGSGRAYNNGRGDVTFTAGATGGSAITSYTVTASAGGFNASGASSPLSVTGLQSATAYTFTVTATNANGTSAASSASNSITATTVPQAPTIGTATNVPSGRPYNNGRADVTFTAGATGGSAITSYTVTASAGGFNASGASSPLSVTGLQSATAYTFTVTATNANGTSAASAASNSITATTVPQAPTIGTATNVPSGRPYNNGRADVTFTAGATGGSAITSYTVTSSPGSFTGSGSASAISVTGLASATAYTFTVTATNANGTSAASGASNSITATTVPQAPTVGTFTNVGTSRPFNNGRGDLAFTAGATGGSAITSYTVTTSPGSFTGSGSASPISVTGLASGTNYTARVTATNANGTSTASAASNSITATTVPEAITAAVTAVNVPANRPYNNGRADVSFTRPSSWNTAWTSIGTVTVTSSPGGFTGSTNDSLVNTIAVEGLQSNTAYTFTVTGSNTNGTSAASPISNSITATTVPQAPTITSGTNVSSGRPYNNGRVDLAFTAGANGGSAITSYTEFDLYLVPNSTTGITSSPVSLTGLATGGTYQFYMQANNANGASANSNIVAVTVTTVPQAATIGTATNVGTNRPYNNGAATITYTAGATGGTGSGTTVFTATSSPGGFTATGASPITVTGLAAGTNYTFTVTASNNNGSAAASAASNSITATTVPQAPTIGTATAFAERATITFTAGATGGSAITTNTMTSSPSSITGTGSSPIQVSGLAAGTAYTFTATSTNANGTSTASAASNSVTPTAKASTWATQNAQAGTTTLNAVEYGNGVWVVLPAAQTARTSSDTTTWTTQTKADNANSTIAYGNGVFIAGGSDATFLNTQISRSTNNGVTWATISPNPISGSIKIVASAYGNSGFIAAPDAPATNPNYATSNADGSIWTNRTYTNNAAIRSTSYGAGIYIMAGLSNIVKSSTDGITWTTALSSTFPTKSWQASGYGNGLFLVGATDGTMRGASSGAITSWTTRTANFGTSTIYGIAYGNGIYVAVGAGGAIRSSTDGTTWTTRTSNTTNILLDVSYGNNRWVAVGASATIVAADG